MTEFEKRAGVTSGKLMNAIDEFNLTQLPKGFTGVVYLEAFPVLTGTLVVPALVHVGENPGPTVMAVAGVHGNEYEGQEAVRNVFNRIDPAELHGTYFGIPVCNVFAYEAKSRSTPPHLDGLNLARVFPGEKNGTTTRKLAYSLMQLVMRNLCGDDLFVDFHSANEDGNYATMVGFRDIDSSGKTASEEAARHFGACPLWLFGNQTGMFNAEVSREGIPSIGTETTGQAGCRQEDVGAFTDGLMDLLRYKQMFGEGIPRRNDGPVHQGTELNSGTAGFLRLSIGLGSEVVGGEVIGEIIAMSGERLEELRAPCSGSIWMHRTNPTIRPGDTVCIVGRPV
jgi:uncharacterized protein